jgi:hypothetical protein
MSLKHTWGITVKTDSGSAATQTDTIEAGAEENFSDVAPDGDNLEVDLVVDVSQIKSFYIVSNKDVKLNTNALADIDADQTINLAAGKMLHWNENDTGANPLTDDITKLFFVNAGLVEATVKGSFLLDITV